MGHRTSGALTQQKSVSRHCVAAKDRRLTCRIELWRPKSRDDLAVASRGLHSLSKDC